jgi:PiT family inorganic phosphate transporter
MAKSGLDKDLKKIVRLQDAAVEQWRNILPLSLGVTFLLAVGLFATYIYGGFWNNIVVVVAVVVGGYMALNIGANDVANTMGPAVASRTLTMFGALMIAAIFNVLGAYIAGGNVISTISKGIIDPALIRDQAVFIFAMLSALFAAGVWINVATWVGAPVSTTHSIVGGVMGAGIAAAGFAIVNWFTMGKIAASWVVSPVMGGAIAALIYQLVQLTIFRKDNKIEAAVRYVPFFVAVMAASF